jgi:uncharacterized GH25 family protein
MVNDSLQATYESENGERKRWRGTAASFASEVPANARNLQVSQTQTRIETFVTSGKPNDTALKATGSGLELVPVTHPNDMVAGEQATFRFVLDGKPAAGIKVTVVPGGTRYRNKQSEQQRVSGDDGRVSVTWADPGMYWLEARVEDDKAMKPAKTRRASYIATFEVLPP